MMIKKLTGTVGRIFISLASIGLVLYVARGKFSDALEHFRHIQVLPILVGFAVYLVSLGVVSLRLQLVLKVQHVTMAWIRLYYLWVVSLFFNLFLPSAVGGDVAKGYYIYKDSGKKVAAVSSVLVDRFLGLIGTISIACIAFLIIGNQFSEMDLRVLLVVFVGLALFGVSFVISRRISKPTRSVIMVLIPRPLKDKFHSFFDTLAHYHGGKLEFLICYAYSLLAQACSISMYYFLAKSLSIDIGIGIFYSLIPLVVLCSMIPSIGGLGVREASTVYLFKAFMPVEQAVALSLLSAVFIYGIGAACGILYAFKGGASMKEIEIIEEEVGAPVPESEDDEESVKVEGSVS